MLTHKQDRDQRAGGMRDWSEQTRATSTQKTAAATGHTMQTAAAVARSVRFAAAIGREKVQRNTRPARRLTGAQKMWINESIARLAELTYIIRCIVTSAALRVPR